jgi:hypoxanthine phosphoribosyltransferase
MSDDVLQQAREALARADLIHDEAAVSGAVRQMAAQITADLSELDPVILCAMNGGLLPTAMLMPHLLFPAKMAPGVLCVPDQIIDYTYARKHTFTRRT